MTTVRTMTIGDTVRLRSGSTAMSVEAFRRDGRVICVWFDARDRVHRAAVPPATLDVEGAETRRR